MNIKKYDVIGAFFSLTYSSSALQHLYSFIDHSPGLCYTTKNIIFSFTNIYLHLGMES